ncbi:hypothetical protein NECAME_19267 [Necator americanus]|uniref:Uncharacterized protein n=1 Tax=Necator americanus TaxID=51031 RepID=W2SRS4_NECAM|nr:hypothetical protein NECAME_19267 [Necator americanus]ETN71561.1 hypothetical protein NECAME_19267 [Necator americanus]
MIQQTKSKNMIERQHQKHFLVVIVPIGVTEFSDNVFLEMAENGGFNPAMCRIITPRTNLSIISSMVEKFLWVSITPFGEPVVPLEYGNTAVSSGLKAGENRKTVR